MKAAGTPQGRRIEDSLTDPVLFLFQHVRDPPSRGGRDRLPPLDGPSPKPPPAPTLPFRLFQNVDAPTEGSRPDSVPSGEGEERAPTTSPPTAPFPTPTPPAEEPVQDPQISMEETAPKTDNPPVAEVPKPIDEVLPPESDTSELEKAPPPQPPKDDVSIEDPYPPPPERPPPPIPEEAVKPDPPPPSRGRQLGTRRGQPLGRRSTPYRPPSKSPAPPPPGSRPPRLPKRPARPAGRGKQPSTETSDPPAATEGPVESEKERMQGKVPKPPEGQAKANGPAPPQKKLRQPPAGKAEAPKTTKGGPVKEEVGEEDEKQQAKKKDMEARLISMCKKGEWTSVEPFLKQFVRIGLSSDLADEETGYTPLMYAIKENQVFMADRIVDLGIDVNAQAKDGVTALHIASDMGKEDAIRLLLNRKADPSIANPANNQLPIHILCKKPRAAALVTLQTLIRASTKDVRLAADKDGNIPLHLAAEVGNHALCRELMSVHMKDQLAFRRKKNGDTALHITARRGDADLTRYFLNNGSDVDAQNNDGFTALHIACEIGDENIVRLLTQFNANGNLTDEEDRSPLHIAAEKGHSALVEVLAERYKASVFKRTKDGRTLMHIASESGHQETAIMFLKKGVPLHMASKSGAKAIHTAAQHGFTDVIKNLLERGEHVDVVTPENYSALHIAVQANQPEVVEILLGHGAQVQLRGGKNNETPLHIAARIPDCHKCAELLIKSGTDVNAKDENGETPLHSAARHGQLKTVKTLLEDWAEVHSRSKAGETPLHVTVKNCHFPVAKLLMEHIKKHYKNMNMESFVNIQNQDGESAMHYACAVVKDQTHYPSEDKDLVALLLDYEASVTVETNKMRHTALHYCARGGNHTILEEIIGRLSAAKLQIACNKQAKNGWSPLLHACNCGHTAVVKLLLQNNARVDVFDEEGKAGLHLAAEFGHADVVDILMNHKAFVNVRTKKGMTPLHLAAKNGHTTIVRLLITKYGATLDGLTLSKQTALHLAAKHGRMEVCETLLELKADANAVDNQGQTPLLLAAENDHSEVVKLFLQRKPGLITMANTSGVTCGHIAAIKGSVAVIKGLMKFDPSLVTTARNKNNSTALHEAAAGGNVDVVKVLLEAGAKPTDENEEGYTALHLAAKFGYVAVLHAMRTAVSWRIVSKKTGHTPLHVASSYGQEDFVRELLTQVPATLTSEKPVGHSNDDYGLTALHLASQNGHEDVVRMLLNSAGVQVDCQSTVAGTTPLHLVAKGGHLAVAGLLLSRATEKMHGGDKQGCTPLHMAAEHGHEDMIRLLLGQGADINSTDKNGWTALHYAAKQGYLSMIQLLVESGASPIVPTKDGKIPLCFATNAGHYDVLRYLLRKEHSTEALMDNFSFLVDLMVCGKNLDNKPLLEFVFRSEAPIDTAVKMSRQYEILSTREKERAHDLETTAQFCDTLATDILAITASSNSAGDILQAGDVRNTVFLDVLIELERKDVVAHTAVQKYLSDVWMGNLKWPTWQILLLFLTFIVCPVTWMALSLPLHRMANIPIIKFMSYLVSHIFLILLLCFTILNPWFPIWSSTKLQPHPHEWILFLWVLGLLVAEIVNPPDRGGLGWIKAVVALFAVLGIISHILGLFFSDTYKRLVILYVRNQLLAVALLMAFLQFLNFLTFHHLFGPWAIIIRDLIKDLLRFLAILIIFLTGFSLHICAIYQPVYNPGNQTDYVGGEEFQSPIKTFEMLFYALFGLVEPDYLPPMHLSPAVAKVIMKIVFGVYMMVTVVVLINLLIAMMSNTYQRIQSQSDKEWKYGRAKLIRNMNMTLPTPAPLNILTFIPTLVNRWKAQKAARKSGSLRQKRATGQQSKLSSLFQRRVRKRSAQVSPVDVQVDIQESDIRPISSVVDWQGIIAKYLEVKGIILILHEEEEKHTD